MGSCWKLSVNFTFVLCLQENQKIKMLRLIGLMEIDRYGEIERQRGRLRADSLLQKSPRQKHLGTGKRKVKLLLFKASYSTLAQTHQANVTWALGANADRRAGKGR